MGAQDPDRAPPSGGASYRIDMIVRLNGPPDAGLRREPLRSRDGECGLPPQGSDMTRTACGIEADLIAAARAGTLVA